MVLNKVLVSFGIILAFSCSNSESKVTEQRKGEEKSGKGLYDATCKMCHGEDGKKGLSGATDLTKSTLPSKEAKDVIENGRNQMAGYKEMYSAKEIDAIVAYIQTLKK